MYKIKQSVINKRKRGPFLVALYVIGLATLFSFPSQEEGFDWVRFSFIFGITGIVAIGSNILGTKRFLKYALSHEVTITNDGLKSKELDRYNVLPWENITQVKQKLKSGKLSKLSLKTSTGTVDLTNYENLDSLALELKRYIKSDLWQ